MKKMAFTRSVRQKNKLSPKKSDRTFQEITLSYKNSFLFIENIKLLENSTHKVTQSFYFT